MTRIMMLCTAIAVAAMGPTIALAKDGHHRGKGKASEWHAPAHASFCPPGLAKKSPACIPPGQAKKRDTRDWDDRDDWHDHHDHLHIGDLIDRRYIRIDDPYRYRLDPDYLYYRALDRIVRVDPDTRRVLEIIGLVDALLN